MAAASVDALRCYSVGSSRRSSRTVTRSGLRKRVGMPTAHPTTDDLMRRVARSDREAFSALYDRVAPIVFGIALRVVRDPSRAEEISQEAFLEVWDIADRFDATRGSARAWIATIAHRRAVDVVRTEEASRRRLEQVGARSTEPAFDVVADSVERGDERARVRAALSVLPPMQRQAIELAYFAGKTYREVAEQVGSPLGTIKTRMRAALFTLGDILGGNDV